MPLGFERLNEKTQRPNVLINFIKPLPGAQSDDATEFLNRVAAICYPIMRKNHIVVMSLEEYPFNTEFVGRNFNAGEVIQLVLKNRTGHWLPFRYVQMVMMHELAHCKQMNHSRDFWKVRNTYADDLRVLWGKGYTGEGLHGRGRTVESGRWIVQGAPDQSLLPEHLCGGTFRSRGRKRKRKPGAPDKTTLTYAERQQRRILKKFGTGGVALGDDEDERIKYGVGKTTKGKPRVAGSKRGRDLRAAAALARFEKAKDEIVKKEEEFGSETDSDDDDWIKSEILTGIDIHGNNASDLGRNTFVKVCEDDDVDNDDDARREMQELCDVGTGKEPSSKQRQGSPPIKLESVGDDTSLNPALYPPRSGVFNPKVKLEPPDDDETETEDEVPSPEAHTLPSQRLQEKANTKAVADSSNRVSLARTEESRMPTKLTPTNQQPGQSAPVDKSACPNPNPISENRRQPDDRDCPVCSLSNGLGAVVCAACSNVLLPEKMPNAWRCRAPTCSQSVYLNVADYGRCQLCGAAKPAA